MATQATSMASVSSGGAPANGYSAQVDVSPDGRFVTFSSEGTNLVAGDTNRRSDVFIRDLNARETRRVSVSTAGAQANASCSNTAVSRGRFVLFECSASNLVTGDTNRSSDVFLRDVVAGVTTRVSTGAVGRQATGGSGQPRVARSGRFLAFESDAPNLVAGDTNRVVDILVRGLPRAS